MVDLNISWLSPIIPGFSMAGIPIGVSEECFSAALANYMVGEHSDLYVFKGSPVLKLVKSGCDGDVGDYFFYIRDEYLINDLKRGTPALSVSFRGGGVFALKVYDFSFPGDPASLFVYKGLLPGGFGLGSVVSDLLSFTELDFDDALEWFYTDPNYGVVEVTGWGVPLEDEPSQTISAICVIP